METWLGNFPSHHKELKKSRLLIDDVATKSEDKNVISIYGKVNLMRRVVKGNIVLMLIVTLVIVFLAVRIASA
ncbi:hypothetical protein [Enterovibrio calviensis]|uniref:hypothetical protein n=1 Tax=Enterovibrio calviensis TaxID=91359 RepID=UPI003734E176